MYWQEVHEKEKKHCAKLISSSPLIFICSKNQYMQGHLLYLVMEPRGAISLPDGKYGDSAGRGTS